MTKALNQPLSVPYTEMKRGEHLKVLKVDEIVYEMVLYHAEVMTMTIRQAAEQMIQRGYLSDKAGERFSLTPYRLIGRGEPYKFLNISPQIYAVLYDYARQNHCESALLLNI